MRRVLMTALTATAAIGFAASPAFGQSATVNGAPVALNGSTTIHFGGPAGTTATADLFLQLTGANVATGDYTFAYTFTNTNPSISNLVNFGFTTDPTLQGIAGTGMNFYLNPNNFPGGFNVNACAGPLGNNNCDAASGQADLFSGSFTLDFANNTSSITLANFVDRYASLSQIGGVSGEGTPVGSVPEPATWAMMLLGFGGIGMAMGRSRRSGALTQVA